MKGSADGSLQLQTAVFHDKVLIARRLEHLPNTKSNAKQFRHPSIRIQNQYIPFFFINFVELLDLPRDHDYYVPTARNIRVCSIISRGDNVPRSIIFCARNVTSPPQVLTTDPNPSTHCYHPHTQARHLPPIQTELWTQPLPT